MAIPEKPSNLSNITIRPACRSRLGEGTRHFNLPAGTKDTKGLCFCAAQRTQVSAAEAPKKISKAPLHRQIGK